MEKITSCAFVYHKAGDVRREEKTIEWGETDLLVKVLASARCGTDKTIFYKGHPKVDQHTPIILGHELVGEIVGVGKQVNALTQGIGYKAGSTLTEDYLDFKEGEKVTVQSRIARYQNGLMLTTDPITILSFFIDGGYSQYMKIPRELIQSGSVMRIPSGISDEEGALVEPAACALESIFNTPHSVGVNSDGTHLFHSGVKQDGLACVIGSGTVSMIYALLCRAKGSREVYLLVRSEQKAAAARNLLGQGFTVYTIPKYDDQPLDQKLAIERDIATALTERTQGHLFDDVISACASPDAQRLMLELYNPVGYAVGACFGGTHALVDQANIDQNHYRMAKTIGTSGCSNRSMEVIIDMLAQKTLSFKGLTAGKRYTFRTDPQEFFTTTEEGLKPVLYAWE
ncbi:alcohol dehydrogenase catalytic domain-containing protein [candidate division KSB3 bacterium]|uniref:Alcohol dehydrogenase catalytic domain-containing protein n=1 Tax=candidate division KSB3 bacterium TaxID=2044937 RepID=A0A9D5JUY5_9BACT|nr:alcohol dehydrogenase catalytic domain-containing protein [candidate division KSB3 bacterium]MBD3324635.1 alcohol dehydrogenase catalytic domain-containing protein [candidate division KSB3 bacterium]